MKWWEQQRDSSVVMGKSKEEGNVGVRAERQAVRGAELVQDVGRETSPPNRERFTLPDPIRAESDEEEHSRQFHHVFVLRMEP
jgi:hypothetical protein